MARAPTEKAATAPTDYPAMVYRPGGQFEWDGRALDTLVVADAEAFVTASAAGWLVPADL
jgi:hypothetical protein